MSDFLQIQNLSKAFGKNQILNNLSFTISKGKIIGLLGENGIGKTTLLRIIAGLQMPDTGSILIDGSEISYKLKGSIKNEIFSFSL
jgi:ABC-type multidrug transport system ATPase subunit